MKPFIFTTLFYVLFSNYSFSQSQCQPTPDKEAVRNGSFELGYLRSDLNGKHSFDDNPDLYFYSDLPFAGNPENCYWSIGDKYAVAKQENKCRQNSPNYGVTYMVEDKWRDHTTGTKDGYALIVDFTKQGRKIAWQQTVDIFPAQSYYFSAWFANYNSLSSSVPLLEFYVVGVRADGTQGAKTKLGTATPSTKVPIWTQFSNASSPWQQIDGPYVNAIISIEALPTGATDSDDIAIDDISFINGCQSLIGKNQPTIGNDTISICESTNGTLQVNANLEKPSSLATYYWYEATNSANQKLIGTNEQLTINKPGTYRVCVEDPVNGCAVNDQVVINQKFDLKVNTLCESSTLTPLVSPSSGNPISYSWQTPFGNIFTSSVEVVQSGNYNLKVSGPTYVGGKCEATFSTTAKIATIPNLEFCQNVQSSLKLTFNDGKDYAWYTDSLGKKYINGSLSNSVAKILNITVPSSSRDYKIYFSEKDSKCAPLPLIIKSVDPKSVTPYSNDDKLVSSIGFDIDTVCVGDSLSFMVSPISKLFPKLSYHNWNSNGAVFLSSSIDSTKASFKFDKSGEFSVSVLPRYICHTPASLQRKVLVIDVPKVELGEGILLDEPKVTVLDGSKSVSNHLLYSMLWTSKELDIIENPTKPIVSVLPKSLVSEYELTVTSVNKKSCSAKGFIKIGIKVNIPTIFSPNNDGQHDLFEISNVLFFDNPRLEIFNQWGNLVFNDNPRLKFFDGKYNGVELPVGTYYYILYFNSKLAPVQGSITLIR